MLCEWIHLSTYIQGYGVRKYIPESIFIFRNISNPCQISWRPQKCYVSKANRYIRLSFPTNTYQSHHLLVIGKLERRGRKRNICQQYATFVRSLMSLFGKRAENFFLENGRFSISISYEKKCSVFLSFGQLKVQKFRIWVPTVLLDEL